MPDHRLIALAWADHCLIALPWIDLRLIALAWKKESVCRAPWLVNAGFTNAGPQGSPVQGIFARC